MDSLIVEFGSFQNGNAEPKSLEMLTVLPSSSDENKETRKLEANQSLKVVGICIILTSAIGITFLSMAPHCIKCGPKLCTK